MYNQLVDGTDRLLLLDRSELVFDDVFAICLTNHGGNYTTLDLDVTKQDCTAMFEPSLDCTDLSATDKVLDGFKQKVHGYVLTKLCKAAD